MKFLALQTDVRTIQETFLVDGEDLLLNTHRHVFAFVIPMIIATLISVIIVPFLVRMLVIAPDLASAEFPGILLLIWLIVYVYYFCASYIDWKYNFLMVTTLKVVIVKQRSFFYHNTYPIHLEEIASCSFESQILGIGHCGILHLHLKNEQLKLPYIPSPDVVAGTIENAVALINQRRQEGEKKEDQQEKIENVQQKADTASGSVPTTGEA